MQPNFESATGRFENLETAGSQSRATEQGPGSCPLTGRAGLASVTALQRNRKTLFVFQYRDGNSNTNIAACNVGIYMQY